MKIIWKGIDWLARAVIGLIAKISPKLGDACLKLWENTELVSYLFVGVATTLVNYVAYFLATRTAGYERDGGHVDGVGYRGGVRLCGQ